jgi:hypothetical protein
MGFLFSAILSFLPGPARLVLWSALKVGTNEQITVATEPHHTGGHAYSPIAVAFLHPRRPSFLVINGRNMEDSCAPYRTRAMYDMATTRLAGSSAQSASPVALRTALLCRRSSSHSQACRVVAYCGSSFGRSSVGRYRPNRCIISIGCATNPFGCHKGTKF